MILRLLQIKWFMMSYFYEGFVFGISVFTRSVTLLQHRACAIDRKIIVFYIRQVKTPTSNYCRSCSVVVCFVLYFVFSFVLFRSVVVCFVLFYSALFSLFHSFVSFCYLFVYLFAACFVLFCSVLS